MENVTQQELKRLSWTVSKAGKFPDTAKLHKFGTCFPYLEK